MKKLFGVVLVCVLFVASISLGAVTTDSDITGIGGGVSEGTDVGFGNITATSIQVGQGSEATPSVAFGDGDSGIFESADDIVSVSIDGTTRFNINSTNIYGSNSYAISHTRGASTTIPVYKFAQDTNTGINRAGDDQLSLIAGGIEGIRVYKNGVDIKTGVAFSSLSTITVDYVMGNFTTDPTFFIECDATLGNISTTLPPVADKLGRLIEVKLTSAANGCYLDGNGAETIDGAAGQSITTQYNVISLIASATEWLIR